jgi:hypothetical protein
MKVSLFALVFLCLVSAVGARAQDMSGMKIDEMVFCTAVQDRAPSGIDTAFASTVENVVCFVRVVGAADTTSITHVWYHEGTEVGRVELAVKSGSWRTWSSKKIPPSWQGAWRVDVLSPAGDVLRSASFVIKP